MSTCFGGPVFRRISSKNIWKVHRQQKHFDRSNGSKLKYGGTVPKEYIFNQLLLREFHDYWTKIKYFNVLTAQLEKHWNLILESNKHWFLEYLILPKYMNSTRINNFFIFLLTPPVEHLKASLQSALLE